VRVRLASSLFAPGRCYNSEKVVQDGQKAMAIITHLAPFQSLLIRLLVKQCTHQGLGIVGLIDNFLNPLMLYLAMASVFAKSGKGKGKKTHGGPATASQFKDGENS
jgi:hypothetical protein